MTVQARVDKGLWWDKPWGLTLGCTPVDATCANCWAARDALRFSRSKNPALARRYIAVVDEVGGRPFWCGPTLVQRGKLGLPLSVRKPATWAVWNDLFHEAVPWQFVGGAFDVMAQAERHTFMVLTKRIERARAWLEQTHRKEREGWPLPNVQIGTTVGTRAELWRLGALAECAARVRFLSMEPLLQPISLRECQRSWTVNLDGVIVGGESGPLPRLCKVEWIRQVVEDCRALGIACFVKMLGQNTDWPGATGRGTNMLQWPRDLRVRELPGMNHRGTEGA